MSWDKNSTKKSLVWFQSIYLWIKLKLTKIREFRKLKGQQDALNKVFDNIESFVASYEDVGYVSTSNRTVDRIDVTVGVERFSIHGQIWLQQSKIIFKVYSWEFDLSALTGYTAKYVEDLNFIKNGNAVMFIKPKLDEYSREFQGLCNLNESNSICMVEPLLNQLEAYTDKRLESLKDLEM